MSRAQELPERNLHLPPLFTSRSLQRLAGQNCDDSPDAAVCGINTSSSLWCAHAPPAQPAPRSSPVRPPAPPTPPSHPAPSRSPTRRASQQPHRAMRLAAVLANRTQHTCESPEAGPPPAASITSRHHTAPALLVSTAWLVYHKSLQHCLHIQVSGGGDGKGCFPS